MGGPEDEVQVVKKLEERKNHLEQVKQSYLKAQDALPFVQQSLDLTDWELRAHRERPPESAEIPALTSSEQIEQGNQILKGLYQPLNAPEKLFLFSGTSTTTSSALMTFTYVGRVRDLGTPGAMSYGDKYMSEYQRIQAAQDRPAQVRQLLGTIPSLGVVQRFDDALRSYLAYRSDGTRRRDAANAIRNLLNGFKGDLWNLARKWPKENMTWDTMAARLALHGGGGREHVVLSAELRTHSSLLDRLADVLKDREGGSVTDLDAIWSACLDHFYTVLGLLGK